MDPAIEQGNSFVLFGARFRVQFWCQYIEWLRRPEYKWYNFTIIEWTIEDSYRWGGWFEMDVGLLGFVLLITLYPKEKD